MFKKLFLAAAVSALTMTSAMAEWQVVSEDENQVVVQEPSLNVALSIAKAGKSGEAQMDQVANAAAQNLGCKSVQPMELLGVNGYALDECPNNLFVFVADDGKDIGVISAVCDTEEKCNAVGQFIGQAFAAQ